MRRLAGVADLAWPAALLVLGALTLARSWDSWVASGVLALAAVAPMLLVRAAVGVGVSRWASAVGAVLLLLLGGYLVTADAGLSLAEVASDVVPRLLTSPQPYPVQADLLVGPVLLSALASVLTALRVDSPHRVAPLVAAGGLYLAGTLLSGGAADPWGLVAVLMLVVAVGGWVFLDHHDEPRARRLRVAGPVALLGVVLLACSALVPVTDPFDPRDLVDPPLQDVVATSPLASVGAWNTTPSRELFRVSGDEVPMRLAVLDVYDGRQWTARPRFAALGTRPESGLPDGDTVRVTTTTVRLEELAAGFVPTPGRPTAVQVSGGRGDLVVDLRTGSVFDAAGATGQGESGLTYTVTGVTDAPDDGAIEAASAPTGAAAASYVALPPLPDDLAAYAARVTAGASTPYQQAIAIQDAIRSTNTLSDEAISGSALWRIQAFLVGAAGEPGARVGTSEQFASAFALIARANGLPSRVVVGFKPGTADADGSRVVTGADALAWPEVYFTGVGWVPFSPTPDDSTFVREQPQQVDLPPVSTPEEVSPDVRATPGPAARSGRSADAPLPAAAWPALGAGVLLLVLLVLLLARAVRRVRHRRRGPAGEWAEVLDSLHLSPWRPPVHASATQIAGFLDRDHGSSTATLVAERADRAAFGPDDVAGGHPGSARELRALRRQIRRSVPLWRRWWWWLDPRVFRR